MYAHESGSRRNPYEADDSELVAVTCLADKIMAANAGNHKARLYVDNQTRYVGNQLVTACLKCGTDFSPVYFEGNIAVEDVNATFNSCSNIYPDIFVQPPRFVPDTPDDATLESL